ncbi:MAG: glycosyl hydrolase family 28 protein [Brevinematales bacterium]|nr:glycosyl hydrolase family 28 protein [Brevinematales bacterium]
MKELIYIVFFMFIFGCSQAPIENKTETQFSQDSQGVYIVRINGQPVKVERIAKFDIPVNYVRIDYTNSMTYSIEIEIVDGSQASGFTLSPKSRNIPLSFNGNKMNFSVNEPSYLVLQKSKKESLFILIDPMSDNKPSLSDPNVTNILTYSGIDNTGANEVTTIIQSAINNAENSTKNIIYFPKGRYKTKTIWLKNNVKIYLDEGAILECATTPVDLESHVNGHAIIENCSYGFIVMNGVTNAGIFGRGTIDGNGKYLKAQGRKMYLVKIENSANSFVEGIISRDSCFWNTLIYRSSNIVISNYKVINNKLADEWNETDGVDFDNCVDSVLYNAFLYAGDDTMAVKSDDLIDGETWTTDPTTGPYINVSNIVHKKIVAISGSSACKVGTKTYGETMSDIVYDDVDIILARRAFVIDGVDTALIKNTVFKNIRIEKVTGNLVDFNIDVKNITWRTALGLTTISNTIITNVKSDVKLQFRIIGTDHDWITNTNEPNYGKTNYVYDTYFYDYYIQGIKLTNTGGAFFNTNSYVKNIFFY